MTTPDVLDGAEIERIVAGLSEAWREALLAIDGSAWRQWPEHHLGLMLKGLGKHGLPDMRLASLLTKNGPKYVLTPLGQQVKTHLARTVRPLVDEARGHGGEVGK